MDRPTLKRNALASLKGNWGKVLLVLLIPTAITFLIGIISGFFSSEIDTTALMQAIMSNDTEAIQAILTSMSSGGNIVVSILDLVSMVITMAFSLTVSVFYLNLVQGVIGTPGNLMDGFFKRGGESIKMGLSIFWRMFLWAFVPLFVAIIFIILVPLLAVFLIFAAIIFVFYMYLRYSMSYYVKAEHPEFTCKEAIAESKNLMKGNCLDLFVLYFSFFGWYLVAAIAIGITSWVFELIPFVGFILALVASTIITWILEIYLNTTVCHYYKSLTTSVYGEPEPVPPEDPYRS